MREQIGGVARGAGCVLVLTASLALVSGLGCKSSHRHNAEDRTKTGDGGSDAASANQSGSGPGIDLNCVIDQLQNPSEPFHYSYKKTSDNPVEQEADVTPQTIDGSFTNGSGSHAVHGVRSDQESWSGAMAGLTAVAGMSSTVALVNHSSAMVREGTEQVNGYDTTKYSIDTSRGNFAEKGLYKVTLGDGGFEKGEAWVTAKGCPVKLSLDSESHMRNGDVDKEHYDLALVKK